jgi:hypothetical protein
VKVRYFVQEQQTMALRRKARSPILDLLFGPPPHEWVGRFGMAGHTYVEEGDPYGLGTFGLNYGMQPGPSDCTMIVPGTED